MAAVGLAPGGTVLAEDVRDLQNGPNHDRRRYRAGGFPASRVACLWCVSACNFDPLAGGIGVQN